MAGSMQWREYHSASNLESKPSCDQGVGGHRWGPRILGRAGLAWLWPIGGEPGSQGGGAQRGGVGGPGGCFINFKQFGIEAFMRPK